MAGTREIQSRIKSIKDTMKITNAMYMISSTKLRKAKQALENTEPYFYSLQSAIARILRHVPEMTHPYFNKSEGIPENERKIGYIVVTADKGLAGAYNHNTIKLAEEHLKACKGEIKLYIVGQVGLHYFEKKGYSIDEHFQYTAQNPSMNRARNITEKILEEFMNGSLDEVYIIYTKMINASAAEAEIQQLLPFKKTDFHKMATGVMLEEIDMLPTPEDVISSIGPVYISGFVYGALVESYCSEQNSRVMAMQNATESAKDMLHKLSIEYNRVRQANITQEITEVISGVKAQQNKR